MPYQTLAQKYRPQTFDDVIGQETVTRTLKNSILQGRTANAYIFCGPRGVGKTSIARLVSKALNCEQPPEKSPCDKCASCQEITQGNNIDVLEIDGASNNGVDEIRTLRENVKFSPSKGTFKIYIIDEVHMLSTGAFNALLKTLEEPPAHVKFIFATTEAHKVLPTIMSRCQRFDFKRISPTEILQRLQYIAKKEKIDIEEKAALLIARAADGSLRDALVVLDQMVSFSEKKIMPEEVIELLGMVQKDKMLELSSAINENDPGRTAGILDEMITSGKDAVFIANSLIAHYRDLMILKASGKPTSDMVFSPDELSELNAQLEKLSLEEILYILQNLSHCLNLMKGAALTRAPLEIVLIKLTKRGTILSLPEILAKLENVEEKFCKAEPEQRESGNVQVSEHRQEVREVQDAPDAGHPIQTSSEEEISARAPQEESVSEPENEDTGSESQDIDFGAVKTHWRAVLNYVRNKKMSVFTFLSAAKPVEFGGKKVVIGFSKEHAFNKDALDTGSNRSIIEEAVNKVTGTSPKIEFIVMEFLSSSPEKDDMEKKKKSKAKEEMKPVIEQAMDIFGGHVVRDLSTGEGE